MTNMLTKDNCGTLMTRDETRAIQMRLLDRIADICEEKGLRYYLSGGTLLGAVRHHGYIPWDDDIDINMPRPDADRLVRLLTESPINGTEVVFDGNDPYDPAVQWIRVYDMSAIIENFYGGRSDRSFFHPVFIDIFPIEGFPEDEKETARYCQKLILIRKLLGVSWHDHIVGRSFKEKALHAAAMLPAKVFGYKRWVSLFQKEVRKYSFDSSKYIGVTSTIHYLAKEKVEKDPYLVPIKVDFENKHYIAPGSYDQYLRQLYGDYMKIPPVEKRNSGHEFKVYHAK